MLTTASSADESRRSPAAAVLPIGSFEQHGAHLPLITDTAVACAIAERLARAYDLFLIAPIAITCSHEHEAFPGTVSISPPTLLAVIRDIRESLDRAGINHLALVNAHGGNQLLANAVQSANVNGPRMLLYPGREAWVTAREAAGLESSMHDDMHGGEIETSILLHAFPELVRNSYRDADHEARDRPDLLVRGMSAYTESGIIGQPSLATAAKGERILDSLTTSFADRLKVLVA